MDVFFKNSKMNRWDNIYLALGVAFLRYFPTFGPLKRVVSILLLFIFGFYSFTFKSHYCYHHDGTRFHGDCGEFTRTAETDDHSSTAKVHEQKYVCYDIQLDKQFHQQDYSFKNFSDSYYIVPLVIDVPVVTTPPFNYAVPQFSCRGGPPLAAILLRGPPAA